jgi:BirA family biotin operon repressor/biotin-[acetyl-CoA-carboxylase] ligase
MGPGKHPRLQDLTLEIYDHIDTTMNHTPPRLPGAVAAVTQTHGRGRTGAWTSPPGGAWLTLHTQQPPPPGLSVAAGGCLAHRLNRLLPAPTLQVKWPNDIIAPCRGKVAGILVEAHRGATSIGVGVNVHNPPPPGAASLAQLGYQGSLAEAYTAILQALLEALTDPEDCIEKARELDMLRGQEVEVETPSGPLQGTAAGIGPAGELLLYQATTGVHRVTCCHITRYNPCPRSGVTNPAQPRPTQNKE